MSVIEKSFSSIQQSKLYVIYTVQRLRDIFSDAWDLGKFQTARITFKVTQGHWYWCHSVDHIILLAGMQSRPAVARPRQDQDLSSQDHDQDQNARTSGEHLLSSSLLSTSSCLSQKLLNKISSSLSRCLCQKLFNNISSSSSSSCVRHKLLYKLSSSPYVYGKTTISVNESTDANVSTKQHCTSQTPSHMVD